MENGIRLHGLEYGTHDVLVGQREEFGGDTVYLVPARSALFHAVMTQLSCCTCDEDFHSNPPFFFFFLIVP